MEVWQLSIIDMASVTYAEVTNKEQTIKRCKDLRLHYEPDTTFKRTNDSDDTQRISPDTKQKTLKESIGKEDICANNNNTINKKSNTTLHESLSENESNYSKNTQTEYDQDVTSVTDIKDVIPKLTIADGCDSEMQTNSSKETLGELSCDCQVNFENYVATSHDFTATSSDEKFITPKGEVKIPKRGIKTTSYKINFGSASTRREVFAATCTVTPNLLSSNNESTSKYTDTDVNERGENLETDGPNVVAVQHPLREDPTKADLILLFTDDDEEMAHEFRDHIIREIPIENLTVHLFSNIDCGQSELTTLGTIHDRYCNILVLITPKLKLDKYQCFVNEVLLTIGLKDGNGKENRMSPVWTVPDRMIITAFISLKGIDYYKFKNSSNAAVKNGYREMVKSLIMKGRSR